MERLHTGPVEIDQIVIADRPIRAGFLLEMDGLVRGYLAEFAQCAARDDTARLIEALAVESEPIGAIALDDH